MLRISICLAALMVATTVHADDKIDGTKLVGTWKITKSEELPPGASAVVTYTKDGDAKAVLELDGKKIEMSAKWKVEGDKLIITIKEGDKEKTDIDTITKLTDDTLITKNKRGKVDEWTRVKTDKKDDKKEEKK